MLIRTTHGFLSRSAHQIAESDVHWSRIQDAGGTNGYDYLGSLTLVKTSGTQTPETHFGDGIIRGTQVMYFEKDHLGSIRTVLNTAGTVLERNDYYPFGMRHANASHVVTANNRYKFNGKEDQTVGALGLLDYGARMYDAQIGRWLGVDPFADSYYPISPYVYCINNPTRFIDPNGMWVNPVYDEFGSFMGIDDRGLQGKPIFMERELFTQGMSNEIAELWNMGAEALDDEALAKVLVHLLGLRERPDYDGFVTRSEGIKWAKAHLGAKDNPTADNMLYIDVSKLDFGALSTSDFTNIGIPEPKQLFTNENIKIALSNSKVLSTVYALGRINMILDSRENRTVRIINDDASVYDWNLGGGLKRDSSIRAERFRSRLNDNHGFQVFYYGIGKLNK